MPDTCSAALLLVDVLNDLDFPGAKPLIQAAPRLARNIAALKRRCRDAKIPAIYVNDNRNRWRSDFSAVVKHCLGADLPGRSLVKPLIPASDDYIVLKPKHSAFFATPLETLLLHLHTKTIHSCRSNDGCLHPDDSLRDSYPRHQSLCSLRLRCSVEQEATQDGA